MTTLSQLESVRDLALKIGNHEDYCVVCDFHQTMGKRRKPHQWAATLLCGYLRTKHAIDI